ncbi:MAG: lysophospholipid acyltransferase family protein [Anaerolineae bacterium]|nr:lysophospholipid acyltransferase family protein [Anaerolineae bacterium]
MSSQSSIPTRPLRPTLLSRLVRRLLRLLGWEVVGTLPDTRHWVLIGAHHTSNLDTPFMLAAAVVLGVPLSWLAKAELFRGPLAPLLRAVGGIPIDRAQRSNTVQQMVNLFRSRPEFYLALSPEGTRKRSEYWKSGFYHIAVGAGVPIVFGFIDYRRRQVGVGPFLVPTGDIEADMRVIRDFYEPIVPRYPDKKGSMILPEQDERAAVKG